MTSNITPSGNYIKENILMDNIKEYEEYYLIKENNAYRIFIGKLDNNLIIKCKNYEIIFNNNDLSILTKTLLNTIDDAFEFIINIFEYNKVIIKDIKVNKSIILLLKVYINNIEKEVEISLNYNKDKKKLNNKALNDEYITLNENLNNLKNEIKLLKKEIENLKNNNKNNNLLKENNNLLKESNEYNSNPKDIIFLNDIVNDSYSCCWLINQFVVFSSINNILYLIYSNKNKSIIAYNIIDNKKINEIKNAHEEYIRNFRYYFDNINKRDLIISLSYIDIKVWNIIINNFELLLNIKNIYIHRDLESACILNNNNQNYIITCNYNNQESIKLFDCKGNKINEINDSNDNSYYIDNYYERNLSKNYIITGNNGYVKSYDYNENKIYHKYYEINNNNRGHMSLIINKNKEIIELIESSCEGNIRIWNFHSGLLLKKIYVSEEPLREICIWNSEYLFVGCDDKTIKLIELNNGKIIKELKGHMDKVLSIKTIIHPKYGKCLISSSADDDDKIKLWKIK